MGKRSPFRIPDNTDRYSSEDGEAAAQVAKPQVAIGLDLSEEGQGLRFSRMSTIAGLCNLDWGLESGEGMLQRADRDRSLLVKVGSPVGPIYGMRTGQPALDFSIMRLRSGPVPGLLAYQVSGRLLCERSA